MHAKNVLLTSYNMIAIILEDIHVDVKQDLKNGIYSIDI